MFDDTLERKKAFLDYKKQKFKKVKTRDFSKGVSPWFWPKMFLDYKKQKFKKGKTWDFSKGVSPWF